MKKKQSVVFHNPEGVTQEELGYRWRFLTKKEFNHLHSLKDAPARGHVCIYCKTGWKNWGNGQSAECTYRTRKPLGYFLPKPAKVVRKRKAESAKDAFSAAYRAVAKQIGVDHSATWTRLIFNAGRRFERRRAREEKQ